MRLPELGRRGRIGARLLAGGCLLVALALVLFSLPRSGTAVATGGAGAAVATPLFSPRRAPEVFADAAAAARVGAAVEAALAGTDHCVAIDDDGGAVLRGGDDRLLTPASTLKLVTAAGALAALGEDRTFSTRVVADGDGNLVLVGGGDPVLATQEYVDRRHGEPARADAQFTSLESLADAVVAAGVQDVPGALLVDDSLHEPARELPGWRPEYATEGVVGALGALAVDQGYATPAAREAAADPAVTTGERFAALLRERGVAVRGGVRRGDEPEVGLEVAKADSPPLGVIVGDMLRGSDNYIAEILLRDVAAAADASVPGTTAAGIDEVRGRLGGYGVDLAGLDMQDGSGLSPANRARCATLVEVLSLARQPGLGAIDRGLAVAGRTGTLGESLLHTPLEERLRAKTGTLDGVAGLAGVVDAPGGLRFALLVQAPFSDAEGRARRDAAAEVVASFADTPEPAPVPAP